MDLPVGDEIVKFSWLCVYSIWPTTVEKNLQNCFKKLATTKNIHIESYYYFKLTHFDLRFVLIACYKIKETEEI